MVAGRTSLGAQSLASVKTLANDFACQLHPKIWRGFNNHTAIQN